MHTLTYDIPALQEMVEDKMMAINMIDQTHPSYLALSPGDKQAIPYLIKAADIVNDVALEQDHPLNRLLKQELIERTQTGEKAAELSLKLFNSLNGVTGLNGQDPEPVCIFKGVHGYLGRNFYPSDLSVADFHCILKTMLHQGKKEAVVKILSARTMVRWTPDHLLEGIDYTIYFKREFTQIAENLKKAATLTTDDDFREYLYAQAEALTQTDNNKDAMADKLWATLTGPIELTLSRENYDDEMTPTLFENEELTALVQEAGIQPVNKDMLGMRVGLVNHEGTALIHRFQKLMGALASQMPYADKYSQVITDTGKVKQEAVDVDLIDLKGDYAQCRGAITTAQNLPNDDKLAVKTGGGRRNVYHRQVRQTYGSVETKQVLNYLVDPAFHKYFNPEAHHLFVIGHENGHSLGPNDTYKGALGAYAATVEENKADLVSIAFMPAYVQAGVITQETLYQIYASWIYRLFPRSKPQLIQPHRIADLIHLNALLNKGAVKVSNDQKIALDFDKIHQVVWDLLTETIEVQLSRSAAKAKAFIDKYTAWPDIAEHMVRVWKSLNPKIYKEIKRHF